MYNIDHPLVSGLLLLRFPYHTLILVRRVSHDLKHGLNGRVQGVLGQGQSCRLGAWGYEQVIKVQGERIDHGLERHIGGIVKTPELVVNLLVLFLQLVNHYQLVRRFARKYQAYMDTARLGPLL